MLHNAFIYHIYRSQFPVTLHIALRSNTVAKGTAIVVKGIAEPTYKSQLLQIQLQCTHSCDAAPCSYLEQEQHMFLTARCLHVEFTGTQHHMQIDLASVEALELIKPLVAGGATKKGNSLYRYQDTTLAHHHTSGKC